jgi:hypothetical protein
VEKKDVKVELVKIFSETEYERAYIDDKFVENYLRAMWRNTFENCRHAIKAGRNELVIDDFIVSSYSGNYPTHERANVYAHMLPYIQQELNDSGIPYTTDYYTLNKILRFKLSVDDLRTFSNVEQLQSLL